MKIFQRLLGKRFLDANLYDALKTSSEQYAGVGTGYLTGERGWPLCLFGHARAIEKGTPFGYIAPAALPDPVRGKVTAALLAIRIGPFDSDEAVRNINKKRGHWINVDARVPFDDVMKELKVLRG